MGLQHNLRGCRGIPEVRAGTPNPATCFGNHSQSIARTDHPQAATIQDMRVDHRRPHVGVAKQLLHRPDIRTSLEEMRREGMAKGVTGHPFGQPGGARCLLYRPLNY